MVKFAFTNFKQNDLFTVRGTLHFEFKDEKLWQEFNMRACAGKKWLPYNEEQAWKESKTPKEEQKPELKQIAYQAEMELV